jgi:hypothetical protein
LRRQIGVCHLLNRDRDELVDGLVLIGLVLIGLLH